MAAAPKPSRKTASPNADLVTAVNRHADAVITLAAAVRAHGAGMAAPVPQSTKIQMIIGACHLAAGVTAATKLTALWGGAPGAVDAHFMEIARDPHIQAAGLVLNFPLADAATDVGALANALH